MKKLGFIFGLAVLALSFTAPASADVIGAPTQTYGDSWYAVNTATGNISFCYGTSSPTCSTVGNMPNISTAGVQITSKEATGAVFVLNKGTGRVIKCTANYSGSTVIGATCTTLSNALG